MIFKLNIALVPLNNFLRNSQAQASAFGSAGNQWVEHNVFHFRWHPVTCIPYFNLDRLSVNHMINSHKALKLGYQTQLGMRTVCLRFNSIAYNIKYRLNQLFFVALNLR